MSMTALVLAAGESKRFGGAKLAARCGQQTVIERVLSALEPVCPDVLLVLGGHFDQLKPLLRSYNSVYCADYALGMGHSIAYGVGQIVERGGADAVMIVLADQAALSSNDYSQLIELSEAGRRLTATCYEAAVAAAHPVKIGAPAIFPSSYFAELQQLSGDQGARSLLQAHRDQLLLAHLPRAAEDIDTRADLLRFQSSQ